MSARPIMLRSVVLVLFFALTPAACSFLPVIPPRDNTNTSMTETFVRIQMYMKEHGDPPASLAVLPIRKGYANSTTDGWGRQFQYSVDEKGTITLTSLGADGKPGGDGQNKDIVCRYRTRNPDGSSCVNDKYWILDAEIK